MSFPSVKNSRFLTCQIFMVLIVDHILTHSYEQMATK